MELFYDTETSGKANFGYSYRDKQPWIVQLGNILSSESKIHSRVSLMIKPEGRIITPGAYNVHKINEETAQKYGVSELTACYIFLELLVNSDIGVCHNVAFDRLLVAHMLHNNDFVGAAEFLMTHDSYCTMLKGTDICKIPSFRGNKWPTLKELHKYLFDEDFEDAHDALVDTEATRRCYYKMIK